MDNMYNWTITDLLFVYECDSSLITGSMNANSCHHDWLMVAQTSKCHSLYLINSFFFISVVLIWNKEAHKFTSFFATRIFSFLWGVCGPSLPQKVSSYTLLNPKILTVDPHFSIVAKWTGYSETERLNGLVIVGHRTNGLVIISTENGEAENLNRADWGSQINARWGENIRSTVALCFQVNCSKAEQWKLLCIYSS